MILEFILWIVALIIVCEIIFVKMLKGEAWDEHWITTKLMAFAFATIFMAIQSFVVFGNTGPGEHFSNGNYFNLIYEAIILLVIYIFFKLNQKLAIYIKGEDNISGGGYY